MVQFASYLRRVLCKTRLIFARINGPIVTAEPKVEDNSPCSTKILLKRDRLVSRRTEFCRYLSVVDWSSRFPPLKTARIPLTFSTRFYAQVSTYWCQLEVFEQTHLMPLTQHLKSLILKKQKAFHKNDAGSPPYKFYRNVVNRERKGYKANFYKC